MPYLPKLALVKGLWLLAFYTVCNGSSLIGNYTNAEDQKIKILVDIVTENWKNNGWNNLFAVGNFSDSFFTQISLKSYTFSVTDYMNNHHYIKRTVPYHSNTIVINCLNFEQFEIALTKTVKQPYWHPLSNIILYYHSKEKTEVLAKMFFIFWYYKAINVVILQYDDSKNIFLISQFNPFTCDYVKVQNRFGCWMAKKSNFAIDSFDKSFICEEGCGNVPLESKRRFNNLGICLGFDTYQVRYGDKSFLQHIELFKDKGKNLQGCPLRAFAVEVLPFLEIKVHKNHSFTLHGRDGTLWTNIAERMNFTIDMSLGKDNLHKGFNYEYNAQQIFAFVQRKVDLLLYPAYQFDLVIAEVDNTIAFEASGVCFLSQRAEFETIIFDAKLLQNNVDFLVTFVICFFCTWLVFIIFNTEQFGCYDFNQAGKDLMNTFRTILSISLDKPPKRGSFRIFLAIAIWSFFIINFSTQAAITSIFSAYKKGKEVDTIEDILEKGYPIEDIGSPDIVLPEDEERFRMINSRRVPIQDLYGCVDAMSNDSHRFCLIDCAVGRYIERNKLNSKGEQYLHVLTGDRVHSHYFNIIFHKHSPLTNSYNKIALPLVEAGLIQKWKEYRFNDIKEETPVKALTMEDIMGIFECYCMLVWLSLFIFFVELGTGMYFWIRINGFGKLRQRIVSLSKNIRIKKRKHFHLKDTSTQTA